jgi:hypothetical protein
VIHVTKASEQEGVLAMTKGNIRGKTVATTAEIAGNRAIGQDTVEQAASSRIRSGRASHNDWPKGDQVFQTQSGKSGTQMQRKRKAGRPAAKKQQSRPKNQAFYQAMAPSWSVERLTIQAESEYEQFAWHQHQSAIHARRLGHALEILFSKPEMEGKTQAWYSATGKGRPSQSTGDRCRRLWNATKDLSEKDLGGLKAMEAYYQYGVMKPSKKKRKPADQPEKATPPQKEQHGVVFHMTGAELDINLAVKKVQAGDCKVELQQLAAAEDRICQCLRDLHIALAKESDAEFHNALAETYGALAAKIAEIKANAK